MFGKDKKHAGRPPESGKQAELEDEISGKGGEGARNAEVTPNLASAAHPEQTSHGAPTDDVGVPPDEELGRDTSDKASSE